MPDLGGEAYVEYESGTSRPRIVIDRLRVASNFAATAGVGLSFADNETPTGTINGSNRTFTLANTPITGTVHVYSDGIRCDVSEFTISGTTLTFTAGSVNIPNTNLTVDYRF